MKRRVLLPVAVLLVAVAFFVGGCGSGGGGIDIEANIRSAIDQLATAFEVQNMQPFINYGYNVIELTVPDGEEYQTLYAGLDDCLSIIQDEWEYINEGDFGPVELSIIVEDVMISGNTAVATGCWACNYTNAAGHGEVTLIKSGSQWLISGIKVILY